MTDEKIDESLIKKLKSVFRFYSSIVLIEMKALVEKSPEVQSWLIENYATYE